MSARGLLAWTIGLVLALGMFLRLFDLAADPVYGGWIGYINDEGRWVAHARSLALFGGFQGVEWMLHLVLAPLYQAIVFAAFVATDPGMVAARSVSAIFGSAILVLFWALLRRRLPPEAVLLGVAWLAFQPDLVTFSRLAIPEVPSLFFELAAFLVLVGGPVDRTRLLVSGALACAAVATKATTLPTLVALAAIAGVLGRTSNVGAWRALAFFGGGPAVAAVALALTAVATDLDGFVQLASVPAGMVDTLPVLDIPWQLRRAALMSAYPAIWLGLAGWLTRDPSGSVHVRRLYLAAVAWAAVYALQGAALTYFPDRYVLHVHAAAAVSMAAGVAMLRPARLLTVGAAGRMVLLLPLVALLLPATRTRYQFALAAILVAVSLPVTGWLRGRSREASLDTAPRRASLSVSAALAATAVLVAFSLWRLAPAYLSPSYTIAATSGELARLLGDDTLVGASGGESLFTANRLRYRSILGESWDACPPPVVVIAGQFRDDQARLGHQYQLLRTFILSVSPEYSRRAVTRSAPEASVDLDVIKVYRAAGPPNPRDRGCDM